MGEEKNFEKKSTKKIAIIVAIVVLLVAIVAGVVLFLYSKNKPEKIFEEAVEDVFELTEQKKEEVRTGRVSLELSANVESNMAEIKAVSPMIKAVKINSITEYDLDKKIFNQNLSATYDDDQVISVDALVQDEKIYVYLNELYSKYIDVTETLESELGTELDLSMLFEATTETVNEDLIKDIKEIVIEKIKSSDLEQEDVELNGEKVKKSTLELTAKDITILTKDLLKKINEYEKNDELETLIQDLEASMEYNDYDDEVVLEIALYTKGFKNEIVKLEVDFIEYDETVMKIEYSEENENKATLTAVMDEQLFGAVIEKEGQNTTINIVFNQEEAKLSTAIEVFEIVINEENENEGIITYNMDLGKMMTYLGENDENIELKATLNIKYKVEENAKIETRDTSNSIKIEEFTDDDVMELYANIYENEILRGLMNLIMQEETSSYPEEIDDFYDL